MTDKQKENYFKETDFTDRNNPKYVLILFVLTSFILLTYDYFFVFVFQA